MKVLISDPLAREGVEILEREPDIEVTLGKGMDEEELVRVIPEYDALIVRSSTKVTSRVIEAAEKLKVIGRAGVGVDNIDVEAATRKGIIVLNTPGANTISAAEHTIALMLALSRNIHNAAASMRKGEWNRSKFMGVEVFRKTLGIIGLGRIGAEVAKRARGLGMRVIAYDPYLSREGAEKVGVQLVSLEQLLGESDYISIHTPLTPETRGMIGRKQFEMMKDGVRIINCARGGIVDEEALYEALVSGKVAGAALDVFEKEPPDPDNPLLKLDNVLATPHLGAATREAQVNVAVEVCSQVLRALRGEMVVTAVNLPSIDPHLLKLLGPYINLAEKIGLLHGQLLEGRVSEVTINYAGELFKENTAPLTVAVEKGLLTPALQEMVNFVNAPLLARERGIRVTEMRSGEHEDYVNLISVTVKTDSKTRTIAGTVYGKRDPRIVLIDRFHVNAVPSGHILIVQNDDRPGAIGTIGTILGRNGINIADMSVGRFKPGGKAVMVINLDSEAPEEVLREISSVPGIDYVKQVRL
ncbi:phosphoglycerate dehydrogenase [Candidatus Poribacteria bacterium]|nr:MAG: phosphoglycerate dehydrogenase [Candidatus Poribacteria bacterium]